MKFRSLLLLFVATATAQTADTVGDVDSYGRASIYLGAKQGEYFGSSTVCLASLFPVAANCLPAPATGARLNGDIRDLVRIDLPARAANSQLCFEITPAMTFTHQVVASAPARARSFVTVAARVRFRSPVLADPTILAANGLPYPDGEIATGAMFLQDYSTLDPGESESGYQEYTRRCAGAVFSKQRLVAAYGLTRAQADQVFNQPISVFVDGNFTTEYVTFLRLRYQVAIFGDKR